MPKPKAEFIFETTQDGSPTVRIHSTSQGSQDLDRPSEAMHSLKGAFSETLYIYGDAIERCLTRGFPPRVLSMGLGLGYVEVLAAAHFVKAGVGDQAGGESFELIPELGEWFFEWLDNEDFRPRNETKSRALPERFRAIYDEILERTCKQLDVSNALVKNALKTMFATGRWTLHGPLSSETVFTAPFGCICFDAFSSKTSPDLWSEDFLNQFLSKAAASGCVLSTYACTGALKRSLREAGFEVDIRRGFASKRDSTFAVRTPRQLDEQ